MKFFVCLLVLLAIALPLGLHASEEEEEPEPTPTIVAPEPPPLAIGLEDYDEEQENDENGGFPRLLFVLAIVVSSALVLTLGFFVFRLVRRFLAKKKAKSDETP